MYPQAAVSQAGYLLEGSAGIWFSAWALRHRAYHLTNLFVKRPIMMIQGRVTSVAYDGSRASVSYSFTHGGDRFGGTAWVKRRASAADWAPGQPIDVIFDPLNPNKSKASIL
ncbi:MAG: hypothetical protein ABSE57_03445 [Bryobacteraceae bacterium]|jgi:hypothetical protein